MESLKWTFVRCWPLGPSCEVNWDAWAAMGTMAGVLTALAAPWIRDWAMRNKADAVFAFAYRKAITDAAGMLSGYQQFYPADVFEKVDSTTGAPIGFNEAQQSNFRGLVAELVVVAKRDVDISRWPAVSLELAHSVAEALYLLGQFVTLLNLIDRNQADPFVWVNSWRLYRDMLPKTARAVEVAEQKCTRAIERS